MSKTKNVAIFKPYILLYDPIYDYLATTIVIDKEELKEELIEDYAHVSLDMGYVQYNL